MGCQRSNIGNNVTIGRNVDISDKAIIEDDVVLGNNVSIAPNVILRRASVIGDNTTIGYTDITPGKNPHVCADLTEIGELTTIRSGTVVYWGSRIGRKSMIGHNTIVREKTIIGHDTYIGSLTSIEGDTTIGDYVGIHTQCHITKFCNIGDYTFIAPLFVGANDREMSHRRAGHGQNLIGFTTDKYVRIAVGVKVLPGVHFGEGCIVGAGSIVTKNVPAYKTVMGVPAKVVRDAPRDEVIFINT